MTNIFNIANSQPINSDADAELAALAGELKGFVLAGYDVSGDLYFTSTYSDGAEALWLIEKFKQALLEAG